MMCGCLDEAEHDNVVDPDPAIFDQALILVITQLDGRPIA